MTKQEILNKAIYLQYPLTYNSYKNYNIADINKLPLPKKGMMYDKWDKNKNHFTTRYHRLYSIPLLCKLLNLQFNKDEFTLVDRRSGHFNLSFYKPIKEYTYEIYGYTRGEHFDNLTFDEITRNNSQNKDITDYHRLYMYSHECSRLINKTIDSNRKLFISGDSQMIPDIPFLSCFFKEIWYFDNRKKIDLSDKWENEEFTDVLVEMNHLPISEYTETNFYNENNNVDLFITAYKGFGLTVSNKAYKIIVGNHSITNKSNLRLINCKQDDILDDKFYSELYMYKYVRKKCRLKQYVGFCHYRKYFNFLDNIPNMDEIFSKYDCIVAKPLQWKETVKEQYAKMHNIEDLEIVEKIIKNKFPEYGHACELFLNGHLFIPYNMFIMKREDFKRYCDFVFGVLNEYTNIVGTDINKRIEDNKEKYLKSFYPNNTIEYQYRIGGYLAERLTNIFLMNNFKKMKIYDVTITETKYNKKG